MNVLNLGVAETFLNAVANGAQNSTAFALPSVATQLTWQSFFGSAPASVTLQLQVSNDNSNWSTVDTSTSTTGESRTVNTSANFIRVRENAISGGTTTTVIITCKPSFITGGASSGIGVRGPFNFAFNTAGLTTGIPFYTPTIGDILLDAWFEITTGFDGTTPYADIGTFVGTDKGIWGQINPNKAALLGPFAGSEDAGAGLFIGTAINSELQNLTILGYCIHSAEVIAPLRFTAMNPLKLVASQTGKLGGTAIGGTAGNANLYIVTATPTTF